MTPPSKIQEYVEALKSSPRMGHQVVYHRVIPEKSPSWSKPEKTWPKEIENLIRQTGIHSLYVHQAEALNSLRRGRHTVVSTPTASGKTLIYNLTALEHFSKDPKSTALYLFPLKALAQDQLRTFRELASNKEGDTPTAAIYDGDTSAWFRKKIRENPPDILLTNPDMLHLSLLPYHQKWAPFLSKIKMVVVDEVHTYHGVFGTHMAQILRRLQRICNHHGSSPTFFFGSATIGNPAMLAQQLCGLNVKPVTVSGAPQSKRHVLMIDPLNGPAQATILLLKAALHRKLRTIVYTQSRKLTELIALWAGKQTGPFAHRISAYRAGLLPEERRIIESRLASGDLLAVVSTSALELGIDIGDLDLCILVGYPGTIVSTLQRGGRVGRSGQEAAMIMVAGEDALDQYFIRNPDHLLNREPEPAVVNPYNPIIMEKHVICAAAEQPVKIDESYISDPIRDSVIQLEKNGELLKSADGKVYYSKLKAPHRNIDLRGTGKRYSIIDGETDRFIGEMDDYRVFREAHPGAVYLHRGETYHIEHLDLDTGTVKAVKARLNYYTKVRSFTETEILEIKSEKSVYGTRFFFGCLRVTDQVTGYEKWRIQGNRKQGFIPLDLPAQVFETEGIWFIIPKALQDAAETDSIPGHLKFDFLGGIHAVEHAAIGIFPLLVMADRNDIGGMSTPYHPQVGYATIFIYDGVPGGAGFSRQAFHEAEGLLDYSHDVIRKCPCETGCPSCVQSPKCGSGNRPIDKKASLFLLSNLRTKRYKSSTSGHLVPKTLESPLQEKKNYEKADRVCVFDLETQKSAQEVGGWQHSDKMRVSCAVVCDIRSGEFFEFMEDQIPRLLNFLSEFDLVVGFNIKSFDYRVLSGYTDMNFNCIPTLDMLEEVKNHLGFRLSLDRLCQATLDARKKADGLQALKWWKQGRVRDVIEYCKWDVAITRDLYLFGKKTGYLLFENKEGNSIRIPVQW
jgi:DEAD/DEAH box helicase domain-containing protein